MVIRISRRDETGPVAQVTVAPWTGGGRRARPVGGLCGQRCVVLGDMRVRIDIVMRIARLSEKAAVERICQTKDPIRRSISGILLAAATVAANSYGTAKVDVTAETKRKIT